MVVKVNNSYLAVVGRSGEPLPEAQVKNLAAGLNRLTAKN
jgi:hypothetical protein